MKAAESRHPTVVEGEEVSLYDTRQVSRRTRGALQVCCKDAYLLAWDGVVDAYEWIFSLLLPVISFFGLLCVPIAAIAVVPAIGCWLIGGIVHLVETDFLQPRDPFTLPPTSFYVSDMGFLSYNMCYFAIVGIYFEDDELFEVLFEKEIKVTDKKRRQLAPLAIVGLCRGSLAIVGFTQWCLDCDLEGTITRIGYAAFFLDPYLFVLLNRQFFEEFEASSDTSKYSTPVLFLRFMFFNSWLLLWSIHVSLGITLGVLYLASYIALACGHALFSITGIVALATADPIARDVAVYAFLALNYSYLTNYTIELCQVQFNDNWGTSVTSTWGLKYKSAICVFFLLRAVGATFALANYAQLPCDIDPVGCSVVKEQYAVAAIVFAALDPVVLICIVGFPGFSKYWKEIYENVETPELPVASPIRKRDSNTSHHSQHLNPPPTETHLTSSTQGFDNSSGKQYQFPIG